MNALPDIYKRVIRIAWPAVVESFFVALASMIDTVMVSSMGSYAVAAIGLTNQPKFIGMTVFMGMTVAVSALVARRKGEGDRRSAHVTLLTAALASLLLCVIVSLVSVFFADDIIRLAGSHADTHTAAVQYFQIIMGGMIFNVITLVINAAQRGSGNTRIAMTTNLVSSIVNICCNYLLIGGHFGFPALGVVGAAIATVFGTVVSAVMCIRSLLNPHSYIQLTTFVHEKLAPSFEVLRRLGRLAGTLVAENLAMRIGFMVTAVTAAHLGTDPFAAHIVGMNFLSLSFAFGDGMQMSAVALVGERLGARDEETARRYGQTCQRVGLVLSLLLSLVMLLFGRELFGFYFRAEQTEMLAMGRMISYYMMAITFFQISQVIFGGCLRAAGDVRFTLTAGLISVTLIRTAVTIITVNVLNIGLSGIWLGILADQLSRFLFMSLRFRFSKWTSLKI